MTAHTPVEVFPLAEMLADEMIERGWQTEDVALAMGPQTEEQFAKDLLAVNLLMCVQKDKLLIGDRLFAGLAKAFGVDEQYLRNLDQAWRQHPDRRSPFTPPDSLFGPISRRALIHVVPKQ